MDEIKLGIDAWCSWVPANNQAVATTHINGQTTRVQLDKPQLGRVPPMQRRRLGSLARVVFHVLEQCMMPVHDETVIFSSRMGEIQRTQGILEAMASDQPVSPAAFSLSVHNAIAGQWSLVHGIRKPLLALAPPSGSPVPALLEAYGHLVGTRETGVTVVCYDEKLPAFYDPFISGPTAPTAVALRLVNADLATLTLSIKRLEATGNAADSGLDALAALLLGGVGKSMVAEPQCYWSLELAA